MGSLTEQRRSDERREEGRGEKGGEERREGRMGKESGRRGIYIHASAGEVGAMTSCTP